MKIDPDDAIDGYINDYTMTIEQTPFYKEKYGKFEQLVSRMSEANNY